VRGFLSEVLVNYSVQTMLDAPCGDVNWQSSIGELAKGSIQYLGVDIVPDLIEQNKAKFEQEAHMDFEVMDLAGDELDRPFGAVGFTVLFSSPFCSLSFLPCVLQDLILCRDALQHMKQEEALKVIKTFEASGSKYIATNYHMNSALQGLNPNIWG
jgi:hypothetical protein